MYGFLVAVSVLGALRALAVYATKRIYPNGILWFSADPPGLQLRYAIFNALVLASLLIFRKQVAALAAQLADWTLQTDHRRQRKLIFWVLVMIVTTYQLKLHWGFWHKGVGGWTYQKRSSKMRPDTGAVASEGIPDFVTQALAPDNVAYVDKSGVLDGHVMFLHFDDGQVLPANYELLNMSWAINMFSFPKGPTSDLVPVFMNVIKHSLDQRRHGRRFLLPESIAYPNHMTFSHIDYTGYPGANQMTAVSIWKLTLRICPDRGLQVLDAVSLRQMVVP